MDLYVLRFLEDVGLCVEFFLLIGGGLGAMIGIFWLKTIRLARHFGPEPRSKWASRFTAVTCTMFGMGLSVALLGQTGVLISVGALALLGIVFVLRRHYSGRSGNQDAGQRLLEHSRDRDDYRLYVGIPVANPRVWEKVQHIDDNSVTLENTQYLDLSQVQAYLVAYPSGTMADYHAPDDLEPPSWIKYPEGSGPPEYDTLTEPDIRPGELFLRVEFAKSRSRAYSRSYYSTTLTNISDRRVRVIKFGGYKKTPDGFSLNTITSRFFTAADFKDWYALQGEWIDPGKSVTDPNNYGTPPVMWAYYCETDKGDKFVTGGILE
jgi:hypothetical protein